MQYFVLWKNTLLSQSEKLKPTEFDQEIYDKSQNMFHFLDTVMAEKALN